MGKKYLKSVYSFLPALSHSTLTSFAVFAIFKKCVYKNLVATPEGLKAEKLGMGLASTATEILPKLVYHGV